MLPTTKVVFRMVAPWFVGLGFVDAGGRLLVGLVMDGRGTAGFVVFMGQVVFTLRIRNNVGARHWL